MLSNQYQKSDVLSKMLSIKFSELLRLFKKPLINKKGSIEGAYLALFNIAMIFFSNSKTKMNLAGMSVSIV